MLLGGGRVVGEKTGIAWCDSSWSPWIGCTKVSPGCDGCYAQALDARFKYGGAALREVFGEVKVLYVREGEVLIGKPQENAK